jgi:glycosyltransferase involved in cell wall biosynthesis
MTKILHITTWYPNELDPQLGIFIQKHICEGHDFAENVVIVVIASEELREPKFRLKETNGVKEIIGYYPVRKGKKWSNFKNYNHILTKIFQHFLSLEFKPDFVHCHVADKSLKIANKFFGDTPTLLTEHWSGYLDGRYDALSSGQKKARLKLVNKCIQVTCVSEHLKTSLVASGITVPISVIPNIITNYSLKDRLNPQMKFLVVADLVDSVKNISGIIHSFIAFNKENSDSTLTIIGDGVDRKMLGKLAENNDNIKFEGRYNNKEVLKALPQFDCLIVNSNFETFSMVTAEAILSGVPVISSKCGGPEQFIEEGVNGFLFDKNEDQGLIRCMNILKQNISTLDCKQIKASILQKVNKDSIAEKFKQLYLS